MEYLKQQTTELVTINSEFPEKSLRSVWSSYDKNVHKVVVPITTQSGITFTMSEITSVEVYLKFAKGAYGPFAGQVEDAEQKTVSFAVPEEVRGQTGNVTISIMIKLTGDRQIDLAQFKAVARLSKIDQDTPAMQEYYVPLFEDLVESVKTELNEDVALAKSKINQSVIETQNVAQVEQGKIQEELPKIQTELSAMNAEVAEAKVKVDELKAGLKLYTAYKMPDGVFITYQLADNLFSNTVDGSGTDWLNIAAWEKSSVQYKSLVVFRRRLTYSGMSQKVSAKKGDVFVFSVYARHSGTVAPAKVTRFYSSNSAVVTDISSQVVTLTSEWQRISIAFTATADTDDVNYIRPRLEITAGADDVYLEQAGIKVEKASSTNKSLPRIYTPKATDNVNMINYQPMKKGISLVESTVESDYTWQFTDEYITYLLSNKADKTELNALTNRVTALEP